MSRILVIDIGTSSVRACVFDPEGNELDTVARELLPDTPADGLVEFDARVMADTCIELARTLIEHGGAVAAVGISNQRGSAVVWDRTTGEPVGPGIGWQDLRTIGACLALRAQGIILGPNQSATKVQWLLDQLSDRGRDRDLCFGTVDTWITWRLSEGAAHVTDASNALITGLQEHGSEPTWNLQILEALGIPAWVLPEIVGSSGVAGEARALPGAPPIAARLGDQQASLVGQGCVRPGDAKITFGTGGMLDLVLGADPPSFSSRGKAGTFPIVAWQVDGRNTWGIEAIMLSAGNNVQWLRDDLGLIPSADASHEIASQCVDSDGVVYVPAPLGLGTPAWDYGARGALFGLTRGSNRAHVVRAVLEGVAQRGADLVDAAVEDAGIDIPAVRVDGGMTDNPTFVQALADATQRPVEISPVREATARGAALMASLALGNYNAVDDLATTWAPRARVEPKRALDREQWADALRRARGWIPELSGIDL